MGKGYSKYIYNIFYFVGIEVNIVILITYIDDNKVIQVGQQILKFQYHVNFNLNYCKKKIRNILVGYYNNWLDNQVDNWVKIQ